MRINKSISKNDDGLKDELILIVNHARRGEHSDAASKMNLFLPKLHAFLSKGFVSPHDLKNITYSFETILMFQQQKDWVAVADILEFEISKLFD